MAVTLRIDTSLLNIQLTTASQYSITLETGLVREAENNRSPNPDQVAKVFNTFPLPISVSSTATSYIGDSRFVTTATVNWDRTAFKKSGNFYIYNQSGVFKTIPVSSSTVKIIDSNTFDISIFDFAIPEGNYYLGWDASVVKDIFGITTAAQTTNSVLGWSSQSLTSVDDDEYNTRIPTQVLQDWYSVLDRSSDSNEQYTIQLAATSGTFTATVGISSGSNWSYTGTRQQIDSVNTIYFNANVPETNWDLPFTTTLFRDGVQIASRTNSLIGLPFDLAQDRFTIVSNSFTNSILTSTQITVNANTASVFNSTDGGLLTYKAQQIKGGPIAPLAVEKITGTNYFSLSFDTNVDLSHIRKQPTAGSTSTNVDKIRLITTETTYTPIVVTDLISVRDVNSPTRERIDESGNVGDYLTLWGAPADGQDTTEYDAIIRQSAVGTNDGDKIYLYLNGQPVRWSFRGVEYPNIYLHRSKFPSFITEYYTIWNGDTGQQMLYWPTANGSYWTSTEKNTQPRGWDTLMDFSRDNPGGTSTNPLYQRSNVWSFKSERALAPETDPVQFADVYYKLYTDPGTSKNYLEVWDESTNQQWTTSTSLSVMPLIFKIWTSLNDDTTEIEVIDQPYVDELETLGTGYFDNNNGYFTIQPNQLSVGNYKVYADWAGKVSVPKYNSTSSDDLIQSIIPESPTTMNFSISSNPFYKNDSTGSTTKLYSTATIAIEGFKYLTHKPSGTVYIYNSSTVVGSAVLSANSTATITWNPDTAGLLDQGQLFLNAVYPGDYWNTGSNAIVAYNAYTKRTPTLTVTSTTTNFSRPGNVVFTLYAQDDTFNGKTVTWYNDTVSAGTSVFSNTSTSITLDSMTLNTGTHAIYASFAGDFNYNSTVSNTLVYSVEKALPTFTLARTLQNPLFAGTDTFTFNVQTELNGNTITYYDQYSNFTGTAVVVNGQATFTASFTTSTQVDPLWTNISGGPAQGWFHRIIANIPGNTTFADRQISLGFVKTQAVAYNFDYNRDDGYWGSIAINGLERIPNELRGSPSTVFAVNYLNANNSLITSQSLSLSNFTKTYINSTSPTWSKVQINCNSSSGTPTYQFPTLSTIEIDSNRNVIRTVNGGIINTRLYFPGSDISGS